ncbi:hypothetical protein EVAR_87249_1 [Eumeta japonica]|uniref:Uncharacterized protein n=1 Tax=Eumeta variegata TaxID=151549 RepID=A0A4C1YPN8_EUMVA|nr:hypothetical protein EVAR_87249_1 [Eumeta japonica]
MGHGENESAYGAVRGRACGRAGDARDNVTPKSAISMVAEVCGDTLFIGTTSGRRLQSPAVYRCPRQMTPRARARAAAALMTARLIVLDDRRPLICAKVPSAGRPRKTREDAPATLKFFQLNAKLAPAGYIKFNVHTIRATQIFITRRKRANKKKREHGARAAGGGRRAHKGAKRDNENSPRYLLLMKIAGFELTSCDRAPSHG